MSALVQKLGGLFGDSRKGAPRSPRPRVGVLGRNAAAPGRVQSFDQALLWVTVALLAFGLLLQHTRFRRLP